jgi:hypothetical protein
VNKQNENSDAVFELTAFLVAAARGSLEEGVFTASYRLLDTIRRLTIAFPELLKDTFHHSLETTLSNGLSKVYLQSEEDYRRFLDELLSTVGEEARRRAIGPSDPARAP